MNKKTVISYCMSMGLLVSTTGCTNEQKNAEEAASPIEQQVTTPAKPQEQKPMEIPKRITTPSGLIMEVIQDSPIQNAQKPKSGSKVTVHYTGWLENGKKFDSSRDRNQPFVFTINVGQVIKGWDEGVMLMQVGEKRRLIIPAALGYGNRAVGDGLIPANSTLIFEVELLDIK
jgi:peptidylprolyl isomerase